MGVSAINLHGTLESNLQAALISARRFRGQNVHPDTMNFWSDLLDHALQQSRRGTHSANLLAIMRDLSLELADRHLKAGETASSN